MCVDTCAELIVTKGPRSKQAVYRKTGSIRWIEETEAVIARLSFGSLAGVPPSRATYGAKVPKINTLKSYSRQSCMAPW